MADTNVPNGNSNLYMNNTDKDAVATGFVGVSSEKDKMITYPFEFILTGDAIERNGEAVVPLITGNLKAVNDKISKSGLSKEQLKLLIEKLGGIHAITDALENGKTVEQLLAEAEGREVKEETPSKDEK